jgi:hypothetical protein
LFFVPLAINNWDGLLCALVHMVAFDVGHVRVAVRVHKAAYDAVLVHMQELVAVLIDKTAFDDVLAHIHD